MNSLFGNNLFRSKDSLLKESLQTQLVACVKDIQLDHAHSGRFQSSSEASDALCTVLEAIFIHGTKESLVEKMTQAMGDPDTRPEPNFWPTLLVFSHREIIDQIGRLNFISTDVGRCRAWLRLALNEGLLTSYVESMRAQNKALNSFYKRSAYLRDSELLDMFVMLISGIETHSFNLVCNSSLLNLWTNQPLLMAGVWSPAMKAYPITSGTDIAHSLMIEDSARNAEDSVSSVVSLASWNESSVESSGFDEDEALKIILGNQITQNENIQNKPNVAEENRIVPYSADIITSTADISATNTVEPNMSCEGYSSSKTSVTEGVHEGLSEQAVSIMSIDKLSMESSVGHKNTLVEPDKNLQTNKTKLQTYNSLVESYNQTSTEPPDLHDLLLTFKRPPTPLKSDVIRSSDYENETIEKLDFEVVPDKPNFTGDWFGVKEFTEMVQHVNHIAVEQGLGSQNYICKSCTEFIGVNFGPARVCGLTGAYYCSTCFGTDPSNEYWVIPARIIFNWDFRQFSVSRQAAEFLSQIQLYPLFDISSVNPKIYIFVEEMERLKDLRIRLNLLQPYLATCREKVMESLQRKLWPRDYLYEKVHHYSLTDLVQASTGVLETLLQKTVELARSHVLSCSFCCQKGFICELCNNPKVIFPFDLESTNRCEICRAVYHSLCRQTKDQCSKCLRLQQREISLQSL